MNKLTKFLDQHGDRLLSLIQALRPKLYNSLTWAIVSTGLALLGVNLFEEVLIDILNRWFGLHLNFDPLPLYGLCLVGMGLLYHLAARYLFEILQAHADVHARERLVSHDSAILTRLLAEAPSQQIMDMFSELANDEIDEPYSSVLRRLTHFRDLPDNHFLDQASEREAIEFHTAIYRLWEFVATYFQFWPENQIDRRVLLPMLNIDRGGDWSPEGDKRYHEKSKELTTLNSAAIEAYDRFRKQLKKSIGA